MNIDIDERIKNIVKAVILFFIFGVFMFWISNMALNKINKAYIRQNTALIGALSKVEGFNEKEVIGIITKGDYSTYNEGKEILKKYSYNESLGETSVTKESKEILYKNILLGWSLISIILIGFIYFRDRRNYKVSLELINKANKIIEGDFSSKDNYRLRDGSFDTLYESFALMEDRIKRDIDDLRNEKRNLKNIINDISHQLKTPLTALLTYNHILKDYKNMSDEDIESFIDLSSGQLERMDWLTITLLKYARLEGDVVDYKMEEQSILNTLTEAIAPLKIKADEKNQEIVIKSGQGNFKLKHDRKWISEALSNVIKNGIEHTGNGGKIEIVLKESPVYLEIEIRDNGEGIAKDKIKKVFDRFYKSSSEKKPKSIGIGLALSKSIVEKHNGSIRVKSKLNEGTSFIITFIK